MQHTLRNDVLLYASFITDHSAAEEKKREDISVSTWDIYHVPAGGELQTFDVIYRRLKFLLGLVFSFES